MTSEEKKQETLTAEHRKKIQAAVDGFALTDLYLVEHELYECTVSHRFACYLFGQFAPEWNVDCEYNKIGDLEKYYRAIRTTSEKAIRGALSKKLSILLSDSEYRLDDADFEIFRREAFPDIIIHKRGQTTVDENLLLIEIKVARNADPMDVVKLVEFTKGLREGEKLLLQYKFGLSLSFGKPLIDGATKRGKVTGVLYFNGTSIEELSFPYAHTEKK
ncbi:MAG: hypothetical protein SFV17_17815 [Candidatus Obscuribacter sp.]|nr:hypothetical protein [Candidatus Obscuribacter sp.]